MGVRQRILSLDILRGITVAAMILVNNPAVWGNAYLPLQHAAWHGLTPTDCIYPFFVFIMGVSAYFSLFRRSHENRKAAIMHVMYRSVLIYLVGAGLTLISALAYGNLAWATFRIMGVLQGLAVAYLFSALLMILTGFRHLLLMASGLLLAYWVILLLGNGFALSPDNIVAVVDRAILGTGHMLVEHLQDGSGMAFEPEGILSSIPRVAQVLFGAAVGKILYEKEDSAERLNGIMIIGTILTISGFLLEYGCPLNKKLWTPSFALVTSGLASLMTGLLYWITDMRERRKWSGFFRVFGVNPLFLYVVGWVLSVLFNMNMSSDGYFTIKNWLYGTCIDPFFADAAGSLVYSIIFVMLVWIPGYFLDKRKIYIKL